MLAARRLRPCCAREFRFAADLRYFGQAYELTVPADVPRSSANWPRLFHREHERTYGHRSRGDPVQLVNARLTVGCRMIAPLQNFAAAAAMRRIDRAVAVRWRRDWPTIAVIGRDDLDAIIRDAARSSIEEYDCTCVVPPDNTARLDEAGNIEIVLEAA